MSPAIYELVEGEVHRHGGLRHSHAHSGPHQHDAHPHPDVHDDRSHAYESHSHSHFHGLLDESIKRSREGVRAVAFALGILGCTAALQALMFALTGSLALLADLIHNGGDALTAVPLGIAFALRSDRAERLAGIVRSRAGRRLRSPALIADGDHARVDAYVSLAVIASAIAIAVGVPILDPLIGLGMTVVILRITLESWRTMRLDSRH